MKRREPRSNLPEWRYGRSKQLNMHRKMSRRFAISSYQRYNMFLDPVRNPNLKPLIKNGGKP